MSIEMVVVAVSVSVSAVVIILKQISKCKSGCCEINLREDTESDFLEIQRSIKQASEALKQIENLTPRLRKSIPSNDGVFAEQKHTTKSKPIALFPDHPSRSEGIELQEREAEHGQEDVV